MTGEYFNPEPFEVKPHECDLPEPSTFGAAWRCECGKAYRRHSESQLNESWYVWKRMKEADTRPNPTRGTV